MKLRLVGCLVLILSGMTAVANASTTLYLPRQFEVAEMGTVGLALMNPSLTTANLTYKWRSSQGTVLTSSTGTLPAKGQMAQTLNQIFPNATASGTFSVDIDVEEVTGLWMYGDFVSSTDGARLLSIDDAIASPAYTFLTGSSEISFMNLGTSTLSGSVALVNSS